LSKSSLRQLRRKTTIDDPLYLDLDLLLDKLLEGETRQANLRNASSVEDLLIRIPTLDSTLCEKCRWQTTCPLYRRDSVCAIVARVFLTEKRGFDQFRGAHSERLETFKNKSTLLTDVQSSEDTARLFAMTLLLKQLERDALRVLKGRVINVKGYENNEVFKEKSKKSLSGGRQRHPLLATLFKDTKTSKKGRTSTKQIFRMFETR